MGLGGLGCLHVLHVITTLERGGAETSLAKLLKSGDRSTETSEVVALSDGPLRGDLEALGVRVTVLGVTGPVSFLVSIVRLAAVLRASRPDIVQSWLYHADLMTAAAHVLAPEARMVWSLRNSSLAREGRFAWNMLTAALSRLSPRADAVVANAEAGRRDHAAMGYRPKAWHVIPNGWDAAEPEQTVRTRPQARAELGLSPDDVAILMPARLARQKDYETFLAAAALARARDPRLRFLAAGRNVSRALLEGVAGGDLAATALGERTDMPRLMSAMDAVTLSSAYGEGCPNAIGEGMAAGLPAIATDVGGVADLVGDTGFVVPAGDPEALAKAYLAYAALAPAERAALGDKARLRIVAEYAPGRARASYDALYRGLVDARAGAPASRSGHVA